jgi:hypothetical protein
MRKKAAGGLADPFSFKAEHALDVAADAILGVVYGVIGAAAIQAFCSRLAWPPPDFPAFVALVLAITQIGGPLLILILGCSRRAGLTRLPAPIPAAQKPSHNSYARRAWSGGHVFGPRCGRSVAGTAGVHTWTDLRGPGFFACEMAGSSASCEVGTQNIGYRTERRRSQHQQLAQSYTARPL